MTENNYPAEQGREWKSYTMRAIEAALTPGTLPNAVLITAAALALKKHRVHLMAASVAISQAAEIWQNITVYQDESAR